MPDVLFATVRVELHQHVNGDCSLYQIVDGRLHKVVNLGDPLDVDDPNAVIAVADAYDQLILNQTTR